LRNDEALRRDLFSGVSIIRRQAAFGLMTAATVVACGILAIVVGPIITD